MHGDLTLALSRKRLSHACVFRKDTVRKVGGLSKRHLGQPFLSAGPAVIYNFNYSGRNRQPVPASATPVCWGFISYFLSSFASATRACWPASDTALMNASALFGAATLPERMLRNIMCLP